MQHRPRRVGHLVKLVNTTDTVVSEDQGTCLKQQLLCVQLLGDEGGQTHGAVSLAAGVLVLVGG